MIVLGFAWPLAAKMDLACNTSINNFSLCGTFQHSARVGSKTKVVACKPLPSASGCAFQVGFPGSIQKLAHGWPESRTSQARSTQRCIPTRSICEASSAQTGRCKLVCASCSTQVALCKLLCASCSAQVAPASWSLKWLPASCSVQIALPASCSVQAALCKLLCASCSA